ncbi:MAG: recombinase family protein, partial [Chloroflexi bacterium]|nr:recombinase family protein [Chloroflexota bacterium]
VAGEYVDSGCSGATPLGERPEGRRLLADAMTGSVGLVLVTNLDRIGRLQSVFESATLTLAAVGVPIHTSSEAFDA